MSYSDGEEGWDGLAELPHDVSHAALGSTERNVKRRTSKGTLFVLLVLLHEFHVLSQPAITVGNPNANANVQIPKNLARIA